MSTYSNSNSYFGSSIPMNSYRRVMDEIHVLFVDHDQFNYFNTKGLLEICEYKVTHVEAAGEAIFMLSNELEYFDLVLANINSPDAQGFKLLHAAVEMDIPIILTSVQDDTVSAMRAIESGALLFIKTPPTLDVLRYLWQHVARERARAAREREMASYLMPRGQMARRYPHENPNDVVGGNNLLMMNNDDDRQFRNGYYKGKRVEEQYDSDSDLDFINHGKVKRKVCTEWTQELHEKFIDAVKELGEGRCFPKEILELMNVPGLTRMQVASHLQKCRNENWRSPGERKSTLGTNSSTPGGGPSHKPRRFGSMPRIVRDLSEYEAYGRALRGGHGSGSYTDRSEAGTQNSMIHNQITYHQHYGALVPHDAHNIMQAAGINSSINGDGFFTSDMNFSDPPQEFAGMDDSSSGAFPDFEPDVYISDQQTTNSMDSTSQWTGCSEDSDHTNNED